MAFRPPFGPWPPRCCGFEDLLTSLLIQNGSAYQTTCQTVNVTINQLTELYTPHSFNKRERCQISTNRITKQFFSQLNREPSKFSTCYSYSKPPNQPVYQVIIHLTNKLKQCSVCAACNIDSSFPAFRCGCIYSAGDRGFELHYPYHPRYFFFSYLIRALSIKQSSTKPSEKLAHY